jgi:hypothetical protein
MKVSCLFSESFSLLLKNPKLFLPKLAIALLYGIAMVWVALLLESIAPLLDAEITVESAQAISLQLPIAILLLFFLVFLLAVDILVNAMYPVMVRQHKIGKQVSFRSAIAFAGKKFFVVFPAVLAIELSIALPFAVLSSLLFLAGNIVALVFFFILFLAAAFAINLFFYVVYPVSVLKETDFLSALAGSGMVGKANARGFLLPALIPFSISLLNFALAFFVEEAAFLVAFVALRFLMALVSTYHLVLSPKIYLAIYEMGEL